MASVPHAPTRRSTRALVRSTAIVAGVRGIDFGLSFLVSVLLAGRFGASGQLDAFFLARRTTVGFADTIRKLVGQVVMPAVVARTDRGAPLSVRGLPRRVYLFVGALMLLTAAGLFFPSALVGVFAPGFSDARHDLTAALMTIMMPLLPIAVVASLLVAVLQAHHRYVLSEGTGLVQRAVLVAVLAFLVPPLGIAAGAWTMLAGGAIGLAILAIGAWPILRRRPGEALREGAPADDTDAAATAVPGGDVPQVGGGVAAAIVLNLYFQATALLDFAVASLAPDGGVAALEYGSRLVSLLPGLLMSSLVTVFSPELIRAMQHPDSREAAAGLARFQRLGVFAQAPVAIGLMLGSDLVVATLFGYGAFDAGSVSLTAGVTAGYAAAAVFLAPLSAVTSAIYADPRRPCFVDIAMIAVGGMALRVLFLALLAPGWGAPGIAWAAAAATAATAALAQGIAARRFEDFGNARQLADFARTAACAAVAAGAGWALLDLAGSPSGFVGRVALLAALGGAVLATYALAATLLRVPELARVGDVLARRFGRR